MKSVFFDVDTQIDFLFPAGALYVPGGEKTIGTLGRLNRYAATQGIVVVSTTDAHAEDDPEFRQWPPHCVAGTTGQQKPSATLLDKRVTIPNAPCAIGLAGAQQVLLEKQRLDCFTNVNLSQILSALAADRYVVYGVVTEICVRLAAFGLLKTGKRVELVTDAMLSLDDPQAADFVRDFQAQGGVLTAVAAATS